MKKILIIDNDTLILSTFTKLFEQKLPYKTYYASQKEKITQLLNDVLFDIAIVDINLNTLPSDILDLLLQHDIPVIIHSNSQNSAQIIRDSKIVEFVEKDGATSIYHTFNLVQQLLRNRKTKVLIVEDSIVDQALLKHILENYQLQVFSANNGVEALDILETHKDIKLVITDYIMPLMNGLELTKEIRKKYRKDKLSIIVISSNDSQNISSLFLKSGANDFVHKGFTKEELYTRVNVNLEIIDLFEKNHNQYEQNLKKDKQLTQQESKLSATKELLHSISHHWRQPLSVISTIAGSISIRKSLGQSNDDEEERSLEQIVAQTQNLSNIIEMFQKVFNPKNVSEQLEILPAIEHFVYNHTAKEYISVHSSLTTDHLKATICKELFKEVFNIVLNNAYEAIAHSMEKKIDIFIENNDSTITIKIVDSGSGVDEEILPKVFDLYFSTKENKNGTGVGLFIAKEIIQNHFNGTISLQNNENTQGATLTLTLPISH